MTRMTDREKDYAFGLLFPPFWPLVLAMALCDLGEAAWRGVKSLRRGR